MKENHCFMKKELKQASGAKCQVHDAKFKIDARDI